MLKAHAVGSDEGDVEHRRESVEIVTERHRITGTLTLAQQGYRSRVLDHLNAFERDFLAVTDVTLEHLDGSVPAVRHDFLAVHRRHVVYVMPQSREDDAAAA